MSVLSRPTRRVAWLSIAALLTARAALGGALWPDTASFPDHGKIEIRVLERGGLRVTGKPGAVPGGLPVMVVSANSGSSAMTAARADGSFDAGLVGLPGSWVIVKYDPTALNGPARWIRPSEVSTAVGDAMFRANTAPGLWIRVPPRPALPGPGVPFEVSGVDEQTGVDFSIAGRMTGDFSPGGSVTVVGDAVVLPASGAESELIGQGFRFDADLGLLFDARGRARMETAYYFSNLLTPTGLPIQTKGRGAFSGGTFHTEPLAADPTRGLTAPVRFTLPLPADLAPGTYAFRLRARTDLLAATRVPGPREGRQKVLTRDLAYLPSFTVSAPRRPRLTWTLLTDVPGADGSRGVSSEEDRGDFEMAGAVVTQSRAFILPRASRKDGTPLVYRLEPFLPMVSQGDRLAPNPPPIPFRFPSGRLRVRVRRPDGGTDILGPAPFRAAHSRAPATANGVPLNGNGGAPADVFQLSTASGLFDYRFPAYGRYEIEVDGEISDERGRTYSGGGRYVVYAAERLDLEPATLPMTPLQVGDALHPGLTVLPAVPAEVDVSIRHLRYSDPRRAARWSFKGKANRFGVFSPRPDAAAAVMDAPGEFVIEATARHVDDRGVLRMGAFRWGQVVETPGAPLLARGRRGRIRMPTQPASLWFHSSRDADGGHVRYPYASGDILWQTKDDSLVPVITVQDREGLVTASLRRRFETDPLARPALEGEGTFEDRLRDNELPLPLISTGPLPAASAPESVRVHGYYYVAAERPGERVREFVSDDQGVQPHGYWFFEEPFGLQDGIGEEGDLPHDVKFLYGGAVYRDADAGLTRYGIYGSLWVHLPDDDPRGGRIYPPFQGLHGGPSGGPIMTLRGKDIDAFVVPLAARPGTILESGDSFSVAAALAPPLGARVDVSISGPKGFERRFSGRANAVGHFYMPARDFVVSKPGRYRVSVTAAFDSPTSAGPTPAPYPVGTVLGADDGAFDVYVVDRRAPRLRPDAPAWSSLPGVGPVRLEFPLSEGQRTPLRFTVAMPGVNLLAGDEAVVQGRATVSYDATALGRDFPNLDPAGDETKPPADTVWISVMSQDHDGSFRAGHATLQGRELHAP